MPNGMFDMKTLEISMSAGNIDRKFSKYVSISMNEIYDLKCNHFKPKTNKIKCKIMTKT